MCVHVYVCELKSLSSYKTELEDELLCSVYFFLVLIFLYFVKISLQDLLEEFHKQILEFAK